MDVVATTGDLGLLQRGFLFDVSEMEGEIALVELNRF